MLSMTGYGRCRVSRNGRELTVELKTVNHRFLDLSIHTPKALPFLEDFLRERAQRSCLMRGHVEMTVTYQNTRQDAQTACINEALVSAFNDAFRRSRSLFADYAQPTAADVLKLCDALTIVQADEDTQEVTSMAGEAFDGALAALMAMREKEGLHLAEDLLSNLALLDEIRKSVEAKAPLVPLDYRKRLETRMAEWQLDGTDAQRIAQEVAILADHCAIDEELARLLSHILQFRSIVNEQTEAGKKLDFLLQEMNREVNTMGSKAGNSEIVQCVVDAKCIIEKLREQVQNVV